MNPQTIDIPQEQWLSFFDNFGEQHQGWLTTIEVMSADEGDQPVADDVPLAGISFEVQGSQAGDVLVETGDSPSLFDVHRIERPRRVQFSTTQLGAESDLRIEADDGTVTLVRVRPHPELSSEQPGTTAQP